MTETTMREVWLRRSCALIVAAVAAYGSYEHQRDFALLGGADPVSAAMWPLSVDGLLLLATVGLLKSGHQTSRREPTSFVSTRFESASSFESTVLTTPVYFGGTYFGTDTNFKNLLVSHDNHTSFGGWNQGFVDAVAQGTIDLSPFADMEIDFTNCKVWPDTVSNVPSGWKIVGSSEDAEDGGPSHRLTRSN